MEKTRFELQNVLDRQKNQGARNRLGQFSTPLPLALDLLAYARTVLHGNDPVRFLDPAIGTGVFYSALTEFFGPDRLVAAAGFEIDPHYGIPAAQLWRSSGLDYRLTDFTTAVPPQEEQQRYNLVICNPPYVRHHHLRWEDKRRLQATTQGASGMRFPGLAGLYCYFVGLSHPWMARGALAGWLIPSEFMDVNYGEALKRYLLTDVTLLHVHRFDAADLQFGEALVSSSVIWFRNQPPPPEHHVVFTSGGSLLKPEHRQEKRIADLQPDEKWGTVLSTKNHVDPTAPRLGDYFTIRRGVATGANSFFIVPRRTAEDSGFPDALLRPILPSPRHLTETEILSDEQGRPLVEKELYLLDCRLAEEDVRDRYPAVWSYLLKGKASIANRYLCRTRTPWYSQEQREPAPFLCTYMGRHDSAEKRPFRFILNWSKAVAPNVYLMLYPKADLRTAIAANHQTAIDVWHFLNSIRVMDMVSEGRVYGGGLYKLEPKELARVPAAPLDAIVRQALEL